MAHTSLPAGLIITIPARGGSKRLLRKNMLPILGQPLLYYSIKAAKECGLTNHSNIYVLSDDPETLQTAKREGVSTISLPPELADDQAGVVRASLHAIDLLKKQQNLSFQDLICLQPTSPLRSADDITGSYRLFQSMKANSLVSVAELDPHYFHWAVQEHQDDPFASMYFGKKFLTTRDQLPPLFWPNGAVKIANISWLRQQGNFFGEKMAIYKMPQERSLHIATQFEFDLCRLLLEERAREKRQEKTA